MVSRFFRLLLLGLALAAPVSARADDAAIARGKYLAILGDCSGCHSTPHGAPFSGGLPFIAAFGTVYSTNITPDKATGLGNWGGDDFYRALHEGIAPGGKHLYPAFPYIYFRRISRQDTDDLFAYLRTLKPVYRPATPNRVIFPINLGFGLIFWDWLYFDRTLPKIPASASAEWKRGEYLVNGFGHCAACHTPKTILFGDQTDKPLGGGLVENWFANNLTGGRAQGLGQWSPGDVSEFLATGVNRYATATGSMLEKVTTSTSHMKDEDRAAIATYLKSLPPQNPIASEQSRPEQMERGRGFYLAHCQNCHGFDGRGNSGPSAGYPSLAGNTLVRGRDPTTVLHLILTGGFAPHIPGKPAVKPMPAFAQLDDGMIADVASYIRNAWGNRAPPVDATQVHILRAALKD